MKKNTLFNTFTHTHARSDLVNCRKISGRVLVRRAFGFTYLNSVMSRISTVRLNGRPKTFSAANSLTSVILLNYFAITANTSE